MNRFESQHTEWKESWRDDLLRYLVIDDKGSVV